MATLKYHDGTGWAYVGEQPGSERFVPVTGGEITGPFPLYVSDADLRSGSDITVEGVITANGVTTTRLGALDMEVVLSPGRTVDLGGVEVFDIASSDLPDGAVSKASVDGMVTQWERRIIFPVSSDWNYAGGQYTRPVAFRDRIQNVALQGTVKTAAIVQPGFSNDLIGVLPIGWRPAYRCRFSAYCSLGPAMYAQVDIYPDGRVRYAEGPDMGVGGILSLDGISYAAV